MSLLVESVYGSATVQGAPATGRRKFGVPPGGAFDPWTQELLNAGVGSAWDAPVLELALCQLTLRAQREIYVAWSGAGQVSING
ncbi:MAG TPA: hypothetical protein VKT78_15330, partial [Fimbriimonadaceae bacterium]|nr:hypothetical protein [Fimbriimonadaceae bacterium]